MLTSKYIKVDINLFIQVIDVVCNMRYF